LRGGNVAGDRGHGGPGIATDVFRRGFQRFRRAGVDHQIDAGTAERHRASPAQPLRRGAHDGLAAGNFQIHL